MGKILIVLIIYSSSNLNSQNLVLDNSFESSRIPFNEFYSLISSNIYGYNYMDSQSNYWKSLYGSSFKFNSTFLERGPNKNILTNNTLYFELCYDKNPFIHKSFALLVPSYRSFDTISYSPIFWVTNTHNPNDSDIYWGNNPVIYNKLSTPLIKDSSYVISYRLLSGKGRGKDKNRYSFTNNFGVHLTTKNICHNLMKPFDRQPFKIDAINFLLQDSILDTSMNWRLIKREFLADSNFSYIHFGQFLDKRKNKYLISKTFFEDYGYYNGGSFYVELAFFLDDIRLLPAWQFLDISPDMNVCEGDSVHIKVLNGSGPYTWILSSQPSTILSTSPSLKIKADTTSMYQVMSPYDTASIVVYVTKSIYDSVSITSCGKYLWRGKWRSSTGLYRDTATNSNGCKSYYTLNFKHTLNNNVTILDSTELRADQDSVSYQWYSCNPWTKLTGEIKRTIKVSKTKSYAVVLNNNKGCIDTSECISISGSNMSSDEKLDWRVFPNPFQEAFNIELDKNYTLVRVRLYDVYGKLIINETVKNISRYTLLNSRLSFGIYYLQVETETATKFFNLKKESFY